MHEFTIAGPEYYCIKLRKTPFKNDFQNTGVRIVSQWDTGHT
jgi:hypothetical protein